MSEAMSHDPEKTLLDQEGPSTDLALLQLAKEKEVLNHSPSSSLDSVGATTSIGRDLEALGSQPVKVPRSDRRGLFGRFTILAEIEKPREYPRPIKWFITFIIAMAAIAAPIGSTLIFRTRKTPSPV